MSYKYLSHHLLPMNDVSGYGDFLERGYQAVGFFTEKLISALVAPPAVFQ